MKIFIRIAVCSLLASLNATCFAQSWAPTDPANREVVEVSAQSLRATLKTIGAMEVAAAKNYGEKILAQFPNGNRVILDMQPCTPAAKSCRRLVLASVFELPKLEKEALKSFFLAYLERYPFVNLSLTKDNSKVMMMRSVVSDFGTPRGNL